MEVKIGNLSKKNRQKSSDLITRPVGRNMYKKVTESMKIISEGEVVVLDFENIRVIDSSFIDEFIVRLIMDSVNKGNFYIKLRNISDIAEINISSVLKSYSQFDKKIVVMTEDICLNNNFYIGDLLSDESDVINFLRINREVSLEDIIAATGLPEERAKVALVTLVEMRLVRTVENGIYSIV